MILAIETATAACSVALFDGGRTVAFAHETVGRGHAERLLPMIAALPGGGRADAILVDCGPGSFTGLRVGIAAARGLGLAWAADVRGYSGLALVALRAAGYADLVAAMPGGHGEVFAQVFRRNPLAADGEATSFDPGALHAFAAGRSIVEDEDAFDARHAMHLTRALRSLDPRPIYGRAPDAKPLPSAPERPMT